MKSEDQIISEMCFTARHDFGLMSEPDKAALRRNMEQMYEHNIRELKIGHDRYEKVRKLNPRQFMDLWVKCLMSDAKFDEEIDNL